MLSFYFLFLENTETEMCNHFKRSQYSSNYFVSFTPYSSLQRTIFFIQKSILITLSRMVFIKLNVLKKSI